MTQVHRQDAICGENFRRVVKSMGIKDVMSSRKSPWQNPLVERVNGSIRCEGTDHIIPLGERHLLRGPTEYVGYANESRTHLSLNGNTPDPREVETKGPLVTEPVLGGLHHRYRLAS